MGQETRLQASITQAGRRLVSVVEPAVPFVVQAAVSTAAFTVGLAAAQGAGMALRISCATPVAGPIGGVIGVGFASALAGQAAMKCRQAQREGWRAAVLGPGALKRGVRTEDIVLDAALGIAFFRVMGGRFASVMPSDLCKVGAIHKESLHAAGMKYATDEKRRELARFFRRDGCHHCGTRRGGVVGDHMPPNKHVQEHVSAARRHLLGPATKLPYVKQAMAALGIQVGPPPQRYYPQCVPCSQKQAGAVRSGRARLVLHEVLHRGGKQSAWHYAGTLIGLRYYADSARSSSNGGGGGRRRR